MMRSAWARISWSFFEPDLREPATPATEDADAATREPPHQHGVAGFEEEQFDRVTEVFEALKDAGEVDEEHAFSDVDSQRDILDFTALLVTEFDKGWEQGWGQVVDAEIADVFETLQRVRFSGP